MLYVVLLFATLASTGKSVFLKKIGAQSDSVQQMLRQNSVSFAVAALVALIILRFDFLKIVRISFFSFVMSVLFAISVIFTYLTQIKALASGNSSSTMLIYSCGFLIPIVFGVVAYKETISVWQYVGLLLLVPALFLIIKPKRERKFSLKWLVFSALAMTGSGITAILQKIHQHSAYRDEFLSLVCLQFVFASAILLLIMPFLHKKGQTLKINPKAIGVSATNGFFIGILNILNLRLAGKLPAVIVFPIYNIGSLILSSVILSLMFKEKSSKGERAGLLIGIAGILLIGIG